MSERPVVVVGGPTAGGKSALSLAIAEKFGGTVINADSMQVYRDLPILTAQPGPETLSRAPHRLYGLLEADDKCSAGRWRDLAVAEIGAASDAGRVPIVVGGTGLYLRALISGLHRMPAVPAEVRARLNARLASEGAPALHAELLRDDPETAERLLPSDSQRIVRALEILVHTGRGQTAWQRGAEAEKPAELRFFTITLLPPRETLYDACNRRFAEMLDAGAEDELRRFSANAPADSPLWKAVGVDPVRRHLAGEIAREEMTELGRRDTRRYAKRQLTWLRHQIITDLAVLEKFSEIDEDIIFSKISTFLLTST